MGTPATPSHPLLQAIQALHRRIRTDVVEACERAAITALSGVAREAEGDTIYAIDRVAEHQLVVEIGRMATPDAPILLVAEGLDGGEVVVPAGADRRAARWVVIVDPIDGTRGLMYQKRPGWILTGVAAGPPPRTLADIELAVQTEIPLVKQHLSDELWAVRGHGAAACRFNRLTGETVPLDLQASTATTIAHGFAMISRFFPGNRARLAEIDDEVVESLLGPPLPGKAQLFEDQYISSGGQLYELMAGHDRFVADLRPLFERTRSGGAALCCHPYDLSTELIAREFGGEVVRMTAQRGAALCCHPYDLSTELIAREFGVVVTDADGRPLGAPLDVTSDVCWIGYANPSIRDLVEPHLRRALRRRGLVE